MQKIIAQIAQEIRVRDKQVQAAVDLLSGFFPVRKAPIVKSAGGEVE